MRGPSTIFQELETLEDRARRPGFGTAGGGLSAEVPAGEDGLEAHLREAVALAARNAEEGQLPFGALVIRDGAVVGSGVNTVRRDGDPTAHAEVAAIREACRALGTQDLTGATVVASCEPCAMCHTVCATVGIDRILYAAPKESVPDLGGIDRRTVRAMQAALRALRPDDVQHRQTPGAEEPFTLLTG